jgi:hypothetical protein
MPEPYTTITFNMVSDTRVVLILNEQIFNGNGDIRVNALRIQINSSGRSGMVTTDIIVGQSHSDITCTLDTDNDGIEDAIDNCPSTSNPDQLDTDGDSIGDACDSDDDNDGILDGPDNCDLTFNPNQADFDLDGIGDVCDSATGPPINKDQCKNDGWMRFDTPRTFRNQGDCIQFVNTGR